MHGAFFLILGLCFNKLRYNVVLSGCLIYFEVTNSFLHLFLGRFHYKCLSYYSQAKLTYTVEFHVKIFMSYLEIQKVAFK